MWERWVANKKMKTHPSESTIKVVTLISFLLQMMFFFGMIKIKNLLFLRFSSPQKAVEAFKKYAFEKPVAKWKISFENKSQRRIFWKKFFHKQNSLVVSINSVWLYTRYSFWFTFVCCGVILCHEKLSPTVRR